MQDAVTQAVGGAGAAFVALAFWLALPLDAKADPCADAVAQYLPGEDGGFRAERLPDVVLGVPLGAGASSGSADVVSLGDGGTITLEFKDNEIVDGPGADFRVFENAFATGADSVFVEAGVVSVSADGVTYVPFPYELDGFVGLAGVSPVFAHPDNGLDPRTPAAGGDGFDLADVGLSTARFVRIDDGGSDIPDPGNAFPVRGFGQSGFDLDAIVASNSREICSSCCDANGDGVVSVDDVVLLVEILAGRAAAVGICGSPSCRTDHCADVDADRVVDLTDARRCLMGAVQLPFACAARAGCEVPS